MKKNFFALALALLAANAALAADFEGTLTVDQAAAMGDESLFKQYASPDWSAIEDGVYQAQAPNGEVYTIHFGDAGKRAAIREARQEIMQAQQHLSSKQAAIRSAAREAISQQQAYVADLTPAPALAKVTVIDNLGGCGPVDAASQFSVTNAGYFQFASTTAEMYAGVDFGPTIPWITPQYARVEAAVRNSAGTWVSKVAVKTAWLGDNKIGPLTASTTVAPNCELRTMYTSDGCGQFHQIRRQATCSSIANGGTPGLY
jgi:hypothetical protein